MPKIQPKGCTLNSLLFAPSLDKSLVASARDLIIYNVCLAYLPPISIFRLSPETIIMTSSEIQCSFCGSVLPATAIFCKDCGKPLNLMRALHQPTHLPTMQPSIGEAGQMNLAPESRIKPQPASSLQSQSEPSKRQASPLL